MSVLTAIRYDGRTSNGQQVTLFRDDSESIKVVGEEQEFIYSLSDIEVQPRISSLPGKIVFADGSICEVSDYDSLLEWLPGNIASSQHTLIHRWESRLRYVFIALVLSVISIYVVIEHGIPFAAKHAAFAIPVSMEETMGEQVMGFMDKALFEPSALPQQRQDELRAIFSRFIQGAGNAVQYRYEFRSADAMGANALALPSGIIVFTDDMVKLARDDQELLAVLAHELGHVQQRHVMRHMLQDSVTALLLIMITGDVASASSFAAALPTLLVQTRFSRKFEAEADKFAIDYLSARKIDPSRLADVLESLENASNSKRSSSAAPDFFSTHPATTDRIRMIRSSGTRKSKVASDN